MDQEPVEVDLESETPAQADREEEVQVVWVQDWAGRAAESEAQAVWVQDWADPVAEDQVAVHRRSARGLELATTAARLLFPVWSPVLRGEPLAGAASRQKKSFSGFSER
jgi:hypothetical protein